MDNAEPAIRLFRCHVDCKSVGTNSELFSVPRFRETALTVPTASNIQSLSPAATFKVVQLKFIVRNLDVFSQASEEIQPVTSSVTAFSSIRCKPIPSEGN